MASPPRKDHPQLIHQLVCDAFVKVAQTILTARTPSQPYFQHVERDPSSPNQFKLDAVEFEAISQQAERWKHDTRSPMIVDVVLEHTGADGATTPHLLERWRLTYAPRVSRDTLSPAVVYKKLVVLMRSLHTLVRLLPAFSVFRQCSRVRLSQLQLRHRVAGHGDGAASPVPHGDFPVYCGTQCDFADATPPVTEVFSFAPVDTSLGHVVLGVTYLSDLKSIPQPSVVDPPLYVIHDYVGAGASVVARPAHGQDRHSEPRPIPRSEAEADSAPSTPDTPTPSFGVKGVFAGMAFGSAPEPAERAQSRGRTPPRVTWNFIGSPYKDTLDPAVSTSLPLRLVGMGSGVARSMEGSSHRVVARTGSPGAVDPGGALVAVDSIDRDSHIGQFLKILQHAPPLSVHGGDVAVDGVVESARTVSAALGSMLEML